MLPMSEKISSHLYLEQRVVVLRDDSVSLYVPRRSSHASNL